MGLLFGVRAVPRGQVPAVHGSDSGGLLSPDQGGVARTSGQIHLGGLCWNEVKRTLAAASLLVETSRAGQENLPGSSEGSLGAADPAFMQQMGLGKLSWVP